MIDPWLASFGADLNQGLNTADVNAANGLGNTIGGDVAAVADQQVGDAEFGFGDFFGGPLVGDININIGVNTATTVVGNGAFNSIEGDVLAQATQSIGDFDLFGVA
ncbi:hypothetical protein [Mongoliimonas terrestris]|uniref:hypothetical protein n=1 Tax=Mongoliimonas terrestris TaxID=1709001 RepID=UPI0009496ABD|nr:hypothetical protein [Mongoliimonas terrestris]